LSNPFQPAFHRPFRALVFADFVNRLQTRTTRGFPSIYKFRKSPKTYPQLIHTRFLSSVGVVRFLLGRGKRGEKFVA
jgi:hypothetical protein